MSEEEKRMIPVASPTDANTLIAQAIEKGLPVETMERLLAMRTELKREWSREQYYRALSNFQAECPDIGKTKIVYEKDGNSIRYKYAPLDVIVTTVKELLRKHGFSYTLDRGAQTDTEIEAICRAHHVDGHSEEASFAVPIDPKAYMSAPQKVASALTYAKRYAFCNVFGIMTGDEDDDANNAPDPPAKQTNRQPEKPQQKELNMGAETMRELKKRHDSIVEWADARRQTMSDDQYEYIRKLKESAIDNFLETGYDPVAWIDSGFVKIKTAWSKAHPENPDQPEPDIPDSKPDDSEMADILNREADRAFEGIKQEEIF